MLKYSSQILDSFSYTIITTNIYKIILRENFIEVNTNNYSYNEYFLIREFENMTNDEINTTITENFQLYLEFAKLNEETQNIKNEIAELKFALTNSDYQIIKCAENFMLGSVLPYDFSQLLSNRTEIRDKINTLQNGETLNDEDKLQKAIDKKIIEMSAIAQTTITNGIDFNNEHYRLNTTDQINLTSMFSMAQVGIPVPYHSDNNVCRIYQPEEMIPLVQSCIQWITYHTTYFNLLKHQIIDLKSIDDVENIIYGMELKPEYQNILNMILSTITNPSE